MNFEAWGCGRLRGKARCRCPRPLESLKKFGKAMGKSSSQIRPVTGVPCLPGVDLPECVCHLRALVGGSPWDVGPPSKGRVGCQHTALGPSVNITCS